MDYQEFLSRLSNPARGALEHEGIDSFEKLASLSEKEVLAIHGIGPRSLPVIRQCLNQVGMRLRE